MKIYIVEQVKNANRDTWNTPDGFRVRWNYGMDFLKSEDFSSVSITHTDNDLEIQFTIKYIDDIAKLNSLMKSIGVDVEFFYDMYTMDHITNSRLSTEDIQKVVDFMMEEGMM